MTGRKRTARRKLLETAVVKVFELYEKAEPLIARGETDAELLPQAELLALFQSVFDRACLMKYVCDNRLHFMVGPEVRDGLGEEMFRSPKQPIMSVGFPQLAGLCSLVGALKGDIQEDARIYPRIVAKKVEERFEALEVDPDSNVTPPVYYKRVVSYSLGKLPHPNKVEGASAFGYSLYAASIVGERRQSVVQGLFSGLWTDFMELVVATFVTYLDYHDSFYRLQVCQTCGRLFVPERQGEYRGKYCRPQCQKKKFSTRSINKCYRNQRLFMIRAVVKLEVNMAKLPLKLQKEVVSPCFPDKRSICPDDICSYGGGKPGGGRCEKFLEANRALFDALEDCQRVVFSAE